MLAPLSGLWLVQLLAARTLLISPEPPAILLSATHPQSVADKVAFYLATKFSPPIILMRCTAIDAGFLTILPADIESAQVRWHPLFFSIPMIQGHLDQPRANLRSTQQLATNDIMANPHHMPRNPDDAVDPLPHATLLPHAPAPI